MTDTNARSAASSLEHPSGGSKVGSKPEASGPVATMSKEYRERKEEQELLDLMLDMKLEIPSGIKKPRDERNAAKITARFMREYRDMGKVIQQREALETLWEADWDIRTVWKKLRGNSWTPVGSGSVSPFSIPEAEGSSSLIANKPEGKTEPAAGTDQMDTS